METRLLNESCVVAPPQPPLYVKNCQLKFRPRWRISGAHNSATGDCAPAFRHFVPNAVSMSLAQQQTPHNKGDTGDDHRIIESRINVACGGAGRETNQKQQSPETPLPMWYGNDSDV